MAWRIVLQFSRVIAVKCAHRKSTYAPEVDSRARMWFTRDFSRQTIVVNKYLFLSYLQANEITRRLQEEEEAAMGSANAVKKLDAEIKRSKEEVENMDLRRVIYMYIATNCRISR